MEIKVIKDGIFSLTCPPKRFAGRYLKLKRNRKFTTKRLRNPYVPDYMFCKHNKSDTNVFVFPSGKLIVYSKVKEINDVIDELFPL